MRRAIGWLVFIAALVGLGFVIHTGTPPAARWAVRLPWSHRLEGRLFEADSRVALLTAHGENSGPARALDAATGAILFTAWADSRLARGTFWSADGRWLIAHDGLTFRALDLRAGAGRDVPLPPSREYHLWHVGSGLAALRAATEPGRPPTVVVLDLIRGEVAARLPRGDAVCVITDSGPVVTGGEGPIGYWDARRREGGVIPVEARWARLVGGGLLAAYGPAGVTLWDLAGDAPALRACVPHDAAMFALQPQGGRVVALAPVGGALLVQTWELAAGRKVEEFAVPLMKVDDPPVLSPDGALCAAAGGGEAALIDLHARRVRWKAAGYDRFRFSPCGGLLIARHHRGNQDEVLDLATGDRVPTARLAGSNVARWFTGSRLWVRALNNRPTPGWAERLPEWLRPRKNYAHRLLCLGWPSGGELMRLDDAGENEPLVAADGSFVVTRHRHAGGWLVQRFDVPAVRPLWPSVVVPLLIGAALFGLRAWWGWRRGRVATAERSEPV